MFMAISKPPRKAQPGGSHPCSIQQRQQHSSPILRYTAHHGWPKTASPAASNNPCPGGYIDS